MPAPAYRVLLVEPLVEVLREAHAAGKLDDDALELALTAGARAWVDGVCEASAENAAEDVESLVGLVAAQRGGEAGLRELAEAVAARWRGRSEFVALERAAAALVDGRGLVASQAAEWLVVDPRWTYQGGRTSFALTLRGLASASDATRAFVGALLAACARGPAGAGFAVCVENADGGALRLTGEAGPRTGLDSVRDPSADARLHRAALA